MAEITREKLKTIVWVAAHNFGELSDETQVAIDAFDVQTYRRLLEMKLAKRASADSSGEVGGGILSVIFLQEALDNLEFILAKGINT